MGLLIALGAPSKSSVRLAAPHPHPDNADDGTGVALEPVELYQTIAHAVCSQKEWSVRVLLSYYDLIRSDNGKRETTMAEARIQLSPLGRNTSSHYRETVHHLTLPDGAQDDYAACHSEPTVLISEDRRHLACLLFHPHQQSSALCVFQLRKPRRDPLVLLATSTSTSSSSGHNNSTQQSIPLPSYIVHSTDPEAPSPLECSPAVATNPRLASVWGMTAIGNLPNVVPPVFVGACLNGTLVWIDYKSSLAVATGTLGVNGTTTTSNNGPVKEVHVDCCTSLERGSMLAVHSNGHASLVRWNMEQPIQQRLVKRATSTGTMSVVQQQHDVPPLSTGGSTSAPHTPVTIERPKVIPSRTMSGDSLMSTKRALGTILASRLKLSPMSIPPTPVTTTERPKGVVPSRTMSSVGDSLMSTTKPRTTTLGTMLASRLKLSPMMMTRKGVMGMGKTVAHSHDDDDDDKTIQTKMKMKQHMDQFVLKELQKKTPVSIPHHHNHNADIPRHRRRRSDADDGHHDTQRHMTITHVTTQLDNIQTAIFCSSTVMIVLYRPGSVVTSRGTPRAAHAFGIQENGILVELAQLELSHDRLEDLATNHQQQQKEEMPMSSNNTIHNKCCGLEYDAVTGSVAVSTVYHTNNNSRQEDESSSSSSSLRYLACVWNWRANVVGWMWTSSCHDDANKTYWSRFYMSRNHPRGPSFVLVEAREANDGSSSSKLTSIEMCQQVVPAGVLSPPCSRRPEVTEPCSLLLSGNSVSFPVCSQVR